MTELSDSIEHAAKMKEAQLKDKPERREWEAAPSFFKWTCGDYEPVIAARECDNFSDKLTAAKNFRQAGNDLFLDEQFDDALMKYAGTAVCKVFGVTGLPTTSQGHKPTDEDQRFVQMVANISDI